MVRQEGWGVVHSGEKWIDCRELPLSISSDWIESLWIKIRDPSSKVYLVIRVYYRLPDQGEPVEEAFLLQLQGVSRLQSLILMGSFNHPDIYSESNMVSFRQSRRLL